MQRDKQAINHQSQIIFKFRLSNISPPVLNILIFVSFKVKESPPQRIWDWVQWVIPHNLRHLQVAQAGSWLSMDLDPVHDDHVEVLQVEELEVDEEAEEEDHLYQLLHKLNVDHFLGVAISRWLSFDRDFFYLNFSCHITFGWHQTTLSCLSFETKASVYSLQYAISCLFGLHLEHLCLKLTFHHPHITS